MGLNNKSYVLKSSGGGGSQDLQQVLAVGNSAGNQAITNVLSLNALTLTPQTTGFTIAGGTTPNTLNVTGTTSQYIRGNGTLATFPTIPSLAQPLSQIVVGTGTGETSFPDLTYNTAGKLFNVGFSGNQYVNVDVNGGICLFGDDVNDIELLFNSVAPAATLQAVTTSLVLDHANTEVVINVNNVQVANFTPTTVILNSLAGNGTGIVGVDNTGLLSFQSSAPTALTSTRVGFGSSSNLLTGDPNYTYDNVNNVFNVGFANGFGTGTPMNFLQVIADTGFVKSEIDIGDVGNLYGNNLVLKVDILNDTYHFTGLDSTYIFDNIGSGIVTSGSGGLGHLTGVQAGGWGTPTGTLSRATFDSTTVTYLQLAQTLAAVVQDLITLTALHS